MQENRGKHHIMRILVRDNWNHTRRAIVLLDVLFVVLFAVGIIAGNEFLASPKVLLCMVLVLAAGAVFLAGHHYIRNKKRRLLALPGYILFWTVYEILFIAAAKEAASFFALFSVCAILAISMSVFAIFSYYATALFYAVQIFAFMGMAVLDGFAAEQIVYLMTPQLFCVVIAVFRYYLETKHISDRLSLESIIEEAETDLLTGLLNRRGLARKTETVWSYCKRENQRVAVLMMDIDYFKLYNDSFGHPQGDVCIRKIGGAILKNVRRRMDLAARVGGEEFLIFMPGMGRDEAVDWANRLRDSIEALSIRHSHKAPFQNVTVSIGMMCYDSLRGLTFDDMKKQADECLYMAKNKGRNCICANGRFYAVSKQEQTPEQIVI